MKGVNLHTLMNRFQDTGGATIHWGSSSDSEKEVNLKSLICPVHIIDKKSVNIQLKRQRGSTGFSGSQLISTRRNLSIRLNENFSFGPEVFLSRLV